MTDQGLRPPDFLNIGAQKAASTWLYRCLSEHPQIFMGPKNRVRFFEQPYYAERDWSWYLAHFRAAAPSQRIGDSRVEYLYNEESAALIARHLPRCRLLVVLRDPVDRALSAYLWMQRRRLMPLESPSSALARALDGLDRRPAGAHEAGLRRILDMGVYQPQLERYFERFDPSRFCVLLSEAARRRPLETIGAVYRFVGVDESFRPASLDARPTRALGNRLLVRAERASAGLPGAYRGLQAVNRALEAVGIGRRRPRLDAAVRRRLEDHYRPHNQRLRSLLETARQANAGICDHLRLPEARWLAAGEAA